MMWSVLVFLLILDFSPYILYAFPTNPEQGDPPIEGSIAEEEAGMDGDVLVTGKLTFDGPIRAGGKVTVIGNVGGGLTSFSCPRISAPSLLLPFIPAIPFLPAVPMPVSINPLPILRIKSKNIKLNKSKDASLVNLTDLKNSNDDIVLNVEPLFLNLEETILDQIAEMEKVISESIVDLESLNSTEPALPVIKTAAPVRSMEDKSNESSEDFKSFLAIKPQSCPEIVVEPIALTALVLSDTNIIEAPIQIDDYDSKEILEDTGMNNGTCVDSTLPIAGTVGFSGLVPASGSIKIYRTF